MPPFVATTRLLITGHEYYSSNDLIDKEAKQIEIYMRRELIKWNN